jgi:voltage-gated potassium channel
MWNIRKLIGLSGVAKNEHYPARIWGRRFEFLMVIVAIWLPLQWYLQIHHEISHPVSEISNWIIWSFFVLESTVLLCLVQNKLNYMKRNWMNSIIIFLGIPFIWQQTPMLGMLRGMQLLLMMRLMIPWWDTSVHFLSRNRLGTTLFVTFVTTTLAGTLMVVLDAKTYKSPWEGIWWAWETVTTVGYGDIVPVTFEGRLLGIFMMLMGVAFLSLLTANFAAYFISRGTIEVEKTEDKILSTLKSIHARLDKIEHQLKDFPKNHDKNS